MKKPSSGKNKPLLNRSGEPICRTGACRKPLYPGLQICRSHAIAKADRLWSQLTPKQKCEAASLKHTCNGQLVAGHGISRVYSALRWEPSNRFVICSALNFMTEQNLGLQWDEWIKQQWGTDVYASMRYMALNDPEPDLAEVITQLEQAA